MSDALTSKKRRKQLYFTPADIANGIMAEQVFQSSQMTLRDYFAGQALSGWIATITDDDARSYDGEPVAFREHQDAVAATCYGYADAMLAARSKKP